MTVSRIGSVTCHPVALTSAKVSAGRPSSVEPELEALELSNYLIKHPSETFFVQVQGESMSEVGISDGDILIVDRAVVPRNGDIVIAEINGEQTIKRFRKSGKRIYLEPANKNYHEIDVNGEMDFHVWAKVVFVIHRI